MLSTSFYGSYNENGEVIFCQKGKVYDQEAVSCTCRVILALCQLW